MENIRIFPGAQARLGEPTAICRLVGLNDLKNLSDLESRLQTSLMEFANTEPLHSIELSNFPQKLFVENSLSEGIAAWVVAITITISRLAGDPVGAGQVISADASGIEVAIPWQRAAVFKGALKFALRHLFVWLREPANQNENIKLNQEFKRWIKAAQSGGLSPNSFKFAMAARQRNIPVSVFQGVLRLGWGVNRELMDSSFTSRTTNMGVRIARNKNEAIGVLREGAVPVPISRLVSSWDDALRNATEIGWPVVVKPFNGDGGDGVAPGIRTLEDLRRAYDAAAKLGRGRAIIEKHVEGEDFRLLIVGGRLLAAARRIPAGVTGDGVNKISELISRVNAEPLRGKEKHSHLITLTLDSEALSCLKEQNLTSDSIPALKQFIYLRRTANISTGGTAVDVTEIVHPDNQLAAERAAKLVGLDIAGVDFLCPDISQSWRHVGGAIIEVNAQPGFRPHWLSNPGRDINGEIIDWLFRNKPARIPTTAITGTNGKSTVAKMLHHIWMNAGVNAGVCTTQGVWVGENQISENNLSGYPGGRTLLNDCTVEAAVIEMPRKGLIVFGHPCDSYDVAALLNVQDDHIGVEGVSSLEEMASLKSEVLARAKTAIVINAEDSLCLAMGKNMPAPRHIFVTRDFHAPAFQSHLLQGGDGVYAKIHEGQPWIFLGSEEQVALMPLSDIPATMKGLLHFNESNALFATALAWAHNIPIEKIRSGLRSFSNSMEQNPGRYNFIEGFPFKVILDYAHNPKGAEELCRVISRMDVTGKRRLVNLNLGMRHKAHLAQAVSALASTFDEFVMGCESRRVKACRDYEGEDPEGAMLTAWHESLLAQGVLPEHIFLERDPSLAIQRGLSISQPGDLLIILTETGIAMPILNSAHIQ